MTTMKWKEEDRVEEEEKKQEEKTTVHRERNWKEQAIALSVALTQVIDSEQIMRLLQYCSCVFGSIELFLLAF